MKKIGFDLTQEKVVEEKALSDFALYTRRKSSRDMRLSKRHCSEAEALSNFNDQIFTCYSKAQRLVSWIRDPAYTTVAGKIECKQRIPNNTINSDNPEIANLPNMERITKS